MSPDVSALEATLDAVAVRQARIIDLLTENGELHVADLAVDVGVSEITVRRDLRKLAARGAIKRSHGGATSAPPRLVVEELFSEREFKRPDAKQAIGLAAAGLLTDARAIVMNDGTTVMRVALELAASPLQRAVTTNACNVAVALASGTSIEVSLEGGIMRRSSFATFSPEESQGGGRFEAAVLGVEALGADGIYLGHQFDDAMARRFITRSARVMIVADSSKWSVRGRYKTADWDAITDLVTDALPPMDVRAALEASSVVVHVTQAHQS